MHFLGRGNSLCWLPGISVQNMGPLRTIIPVILSEQIIADDRNKHGSGNNFILPVMPDLGLPGMEREQLKFNLTSCFEQDKEPFRERLYFPSTAVHEE